jgi:hypothetical protein
MANITIGADPELFVKHNGKFISAYGMVPGSKHEPHVVDKGAVQVDGMALEFNIDPATSPEAFKDNILSVMDTLQGMIDNEYEVVAAPVADFGMDYISAQPPEATELGCDPDYNAYTEEENPRPDGNANFRTGAGHIHIGWTEGMDVDEKTHFEACCMVAKELDFFLGIPSLYFDKDVKRRELYGQLGAFRPKPYGMEYRVLSNKWLESPELIDFMYSQVHKAMDGMFAKRHKTKIFSSIKVLAELRHQDKHSNYLKRYEVCSDDEISWLETMRGPLT